MRNNKTLGRINSWPLYLRILTTLVFLAISPLLLAQDQKGGMFIGKFINAQTKEPLPLVGVLINETGQGAETDSLGIITMGPLPMGIYTINAAHLGFENILQRKVYIFNGETTSINFEMIPLSNTLDGITVQAAPFKEGIDVPPALYNILSTEIQRNPGSDNDISKVIRTLPGVTTMSSFRNDLIIRGGAPNENRFFLDEIEIPVINHLVTQGASGGAYSIINARHLREVDYMSSSFPANRGNALSSVFNFMMKDGNCEDANTTIWMGGTEAGIALETPLGDNASMLLSARRSYRQYILQLLNFAFLPIYNDMTAKFKVNLNKKSSLTLLGIGAIDNFKLNENVGNNEVQRYLLENLPLSQQSNYTIGAVYNYYTNRSTWTFVGSRSVLNNSADKYYNNDSSLEENLILKYTSGEYSNRARAEYAYATNQFKLSLGTSLEDLSGTYDVFNRIYNEYGPIDVDYVSELRYQQYGFYTQLSKGFFNNRLLLTAGGRADGNNYNDLMQNPLDQLSGRLNLSIGLTDQLSLNVGTANYFMMPSMITLSYKDSGELDNQDVAQYLQSRHFTGGFRWETNIASRLSVEGFIKKYPNYMLSLRDSISLAHQPVDFGVFGNYPVSFNSEGQAYGFELFYQQRLFRGFYGMLAYTLSWSEYKDKEGTFVPSTWDARHIVNFTMGKRFNDKWEVGINWRMQSALPFSPFDMELSSLRPAWDVNNQGIRDYGLLNTERGKSTNIISARVDRIYKFPKWTLNLFMDLENLTSDTDSQQALILDRATDAEGNLTNEGLILNPQDPYEQQQYRLKFIANAQGAFIPTFGFIASF